MIDDAAFGGCVGLTSVTIPDSVTFIYELAFDHCTGLRNITILNSDTIIVPGAFYECAGLTVTYQGQEYNYANDPDGWWGE